MHMAFLSQESNPTADNEIRMRIKKKWKRNRSDQEQAGEDVNGVSSEKEVHGTSGAVLGANPASYKDMLSGANQSQDSAWQEWTENDDGDPMCFDEAISDEVWDDLQELIMRGDGKPVIAPRDIPCTPQSQKAQLSDFTNINKEN